MTVCARVVELLGVYMAGQLPAATRGAVARHLSTCPRCETVAAEYRVVIRLAHSLPRPAPSTTAATRLLDALRSAAARPGCGAMDETTPEVPALAPGRGGAGG